MRSTTPPPILPPTSGLAQRRWRRIAQLDGAFAFYASRRRLRALPGGGGGGAQLDRGFAFSASRPQLRAWPGGGGGGVLRWTGSLLSTPLAVNFGLGPEGAPEGRPTKRGFCFSSSLGVAHCFGPAGRNSSAPSPSRVFAADCA